jgi:hypothetical protein
LAELSKTTIAYTVCLLLEEAGLPFASFFCSLQLDSKDFLVSILCRDLFKSYATNVSPILEGESTLA